MGGRGGHGGGGHGGGGRHGGGGFHGGFGGGGHRGGPHFGGGFGGGPRMGVGPLGFRLIPAHFHRPPPLLIRPMVLLPPVYISEESKMLVGGEGERDQYLYYEIAFDEGGFLEHWFPSTFPVTQYYMMVPNPKQLKKTADQKMPEPFFIMRTFTRGESCCCPTIEDSHRTHPIPEWVQFAEKIWNEYNAPLPLNVHGSLGPAGFEQPPNPEPKDAKPANFDYPSS